MILGFILSMLACGSPPARPAETREVRLRVEGMACEACAQSIESALDRAPGVEDATVDFGATTAVVRFDGSRTGATELERVIDGLGFEASVLP